MRRALPLLLALTACSTKGARIVSLADGYRAPDLVALLPPDNQSVSLAAPDTFRRVSATVLVALGYLPLASPAQEAQLRELGVTDGGQLGSAEPGELSERLGADGLVYGRVEAFDDLNLGVYHSRKVAGRLRAEGPEGEDGWEVEGRSAERDVAVLGGAASGLAGGLARKLVEGALNIHLLSEASMAAAQMHAKIPDWPETPKGKWKKLRREAERAKR